MAMLGDEFSLTSQLTFKYFEQKKKKALYKLGEALRRNKVDKEVIPLIDLINSFPQWFTTSSCAGRVALLSKEGVRSKYTATFWYKTHDPSEIQTMKECIPTEFDGQLWLLVSPPMFHVVARTLKDAHELQLMAKQARLGYSKIQSVKPSIVVEILGTGMLSLPIGQDGEIFVTESYLDYVLRIGEEMLREDQQRMWKWHDLLVQFKKTGNNHGTRERKGNLGN